MSYYGGTNLGAAVTADQFAKSLVSAGLLSADEVKAWWNGLPAASRPKDDKTFAQLLVGQGKLTEFQAQELLAGSSTPLVLGDYVLLGRIGAGGMGQVFKAHHRHMKRQVAIKLLPSAMTKDEAAIKRFQREVEAAAKLSHPNIVQAFDASVQRGIWYLVMEYVEGRDLATVLAQEGPLSVARTINYIRQAAQGLAFAHENGVVHRDIKPANLLLDKKSTVKILDMGLARFDDQQAAVAAAQEGLTQSGQVMGTVDYMAPEQAFDTRQADARADIYSLGCTLYKLLTGRNLYDGETLVQKLMAHQQLPIPSLKEKRPEVPPALARLFEQMVAKQPDQRIQSMAEVEAALAWLDQPATSTGGTASTQKPEADSKLTQFFRSVTGGKKPSGATSAFPATVVPGKSTSTGPAPAPIAATISLSQPQITTDPVSERSLQVARENTPQPALAAKAKAAHRRLALLVGSLLGVAALVGVWTTFNKFGNHSAVVPTPGQGSTPGTNAPPLAIAPFDEAQAQKHQQAWADYLGLPVEKEITLPGGQKLTMVLIPPGEFLMGSTEAEQAQFLAEAEAAKDQNAIDRIPGEGPQHRVRITKPFYLGKYELTQAQWQAVMGSNPSKFPEVPQHPVEQVSWTDIQPFLAKLNEGSSESPMEFALPTEAQWEYACRGGTTTHYYFGDDPGRLSQYGWSSLNAGGKTHPVGQLRGNGFGLYDMAGNVREWCRDWYSTDYYASSPEEDPHGPLSGSYRVGRGGSWYDHPRDCRSAYRSSNAPGHRHSYLGFRLAALIDLAKLGRSTAALQSSNRPAPPLAIAPFDEAQALKHQQAWADYLGLPVEKEIALPGGEKLTMVLIPPGEFDMGSDKAEQDLFLEEARQAKDPFSLQWIPAGSPPHRVRISRPFYLGRYEVTQAHWQAVVGENPAHFGNRPTHPVEQVSWLAAQDFVRQLAAKASASGLRWRLPSEAQWEYACRAGSTTYWHSGNTSQSVQECGWFDTNSLQSTQPVGRLKPNGFGLYDMHGNVWEWCADRFAANYYGNSPTIDPSGPASGATVVHRGGGWDGPVRHGRSANRHDFAPDRWAMTLGFRLAAETEPPAAAIAPGTGPSTTGQAN